jgi:hypothetical protein
VQRISELPVGIDQSLEKRAEVLFGDALRRVVALMRLSLLPGYQ